MRRTQIRYFAGELARNLRRHPLLTAISVTTIAMSLILVGFFFAIWLGGSNLLSDFAKEIHMTVYIDGALPEEEQNKAAMEIEKALLATDEVSASPPPKILSVQEDRQRNLELLPKDLRANLSEKEREELIPGGMCVDVVLKPKFRNQAGLQAIRELVTRFEKHERIVDVLSGGEEVQLAFAVVGAIRMFGIIISVLILTGAVFFVFSTIRLSVHARKEEILIRQLMGATRNFIRIPFYLEGMAVGALGAFLAIGIVAVLTERMNSYIRYTQGLPYKVPFLSSSLIFGFVCAGILLGLLGSMFALGRYLKDPS